MSLVILHRRRLQQEEPWIPVFRTTSNSSNWCFNRFRLYTSVDEAEIEARMSDGTVIDTQLFRTSGYAWGGDFEMSALFDFSFNTANDEIEIFIRKKGNAKFMQCYAYTGHAGSAVRWSEDVNVTESISNAFLTYVNMGYLKFDESPSTGFVYLENNGINQIDGADQFYGKTLDLRNNNIPATTADELIIGCDNNGMGVGTLLLAGNNGRTSASDTAWNSLTSKGWTLSI